LTITSVSFSTHNGRVEIIVSGTYNAPPNADYIYAIARPGEEPSGTANWLASEPVTAKNGSWTADITLTAAESGQRMTVFAVLAGPCPPGPTLCPPPSFDPEVFREMLEQGGPQAADYSSQPWLTSAAPTIP
jgi:hypothetical protein